MRVRWPRLILFFCGWFFCVWIFSRPLIDSNGILLHLPNTWGPGPDAFRLREFLRENRIGKTGKYTSKQVNSRENKRGK